MTAKSGYLPSQTQLADWYNGVSTSRSLNLTSHIGPQLNIKRQMHCHVCRQTTPTRLPIEDDIPTAAIETASNYNHEVTFQQVHCQSTAYVVKKNENL